MLIIPAEGIVIAALAWLVSLPLSAPMSVVLSIAFGILVTVVLGIIGFSAAPQLLAWMHATPGTLRIGTSYARIVLGANFAIVMIFLINGIFRGAGDAAIAMRTLWMANLINLVLDPGETKTVAFRATKAGVYPFYCTNFCSAMHQEMQGYLLVRPRGGQTTAQALRQQRRQGE